MLFCFLFVEADDVTKQDNMSRFHRNLFQQITNQGLGQDEGLKTETEERLGDGRAEEEEGKGEVTSGNDGVQDQGPEESPTRSEQSQTDSRLTVEQEIDKPTPGDREEENGRGSLFPPTVDKEARRKMASAKRSNKETLKSARERYLARKKAKLSITDN